MNLRQSILVAAILSMCMAMTLMRSIAQEDRTKSLPARTDIERLFTKAKSHPRLIAGLKEFESVKSKLETEPLKSWFQVVKARAALEWKQPLIGDEMSVATNSANKPKITADYMTSSRAFFVRALDFAFLYRMASSQDEERYYAERLYQELQSLNKLEKWDTPQKVFLISSEIAFGAAIAYDWLYDYWKKTSTTEDDRLKFIAELLVSRYMTPAFEYYRPNTPGGFGKPDGGNWGVVCNCSVMMVALAIGLDLQNVENSPTQGIEELMFQSLRSLDATVFRFREDDGAWVEGMSYWHYSTFFLVNALATMGNAFRTDFGFLDRHDLRSVGWFPIYATSPRNFLYYKEKKRASTPQFLNFNFADSGEGPPACDSYMFWLANRNPKAKPEYAWWAYEGRGLNQVDSQTVPQLPKMLSLSVTPSPLDFLWFVPEEEAMSRIPAAGLRIFGNHGFREVPELKGTKDKSVHGINMVLVHGPFQDPEAPYLFCKGGSNGEKHGQLDLGSFVYGAMGQRWIVDLGSDSYSADYFGTGTNRWSYYRASAEGNNTLVLDEKATPQQLVDGTARIIQAKSIERSSGANIASIVLDLSDAYDVSKKNNWQVQRGFLFNQSKGVLLVQDEVTSKGKETVFWSTLHFPRYMEIQISKDARSAVVSNPMTQRAILMTVLSRETVLKQEEQDIGPKGITPKSGQLDNVDFQRIRVISSKSENPINSIEIYPLADTKATDVKHAEFKRLRQWPR